MNPGGRQLSDAECEAIMRLEQGLTEWMRAQPASVEWSLMALGIAAARLIYGVGVLKGVDAGVDAARLLDASVAKALQVFGGHREPPLSIH